MDLASDAHGNLLVVDEANRLQVFNHEGKHLCTRSDLGLRASTDSTKGIAWSTGGDCNGEWRGKQCPCIAQCVVQPLFVNAGRLV
jgi:hypothetical protein